MRGVLVIESDLSALHVQQIAEEPLLGPCRHRGERRVHVVVVRHPRRQRKGGRRELDLAGPLPRERIGRGQPLVRVDLAAVHRDAIRRRRGDEEPGGEANGTDRRRRPVDGERQRIRRDVDTRLLAGLANRRPARRRGVVARRIGIGVRGVDPAAGKHPVASVEGQCGIAPQKENLQPAAAGPYQHDRGGRPRLDGGDAHGV